jgi:HK97 family phage prohead protease
LEKIEFNSRIELSKDLQENEDVSFSTVMVDTSEAQGHSASISFNALKDFQVKFKEDNRKLKLLKNHETYDVDSIIGYIEKIDVNEENKSLVGYGKILNLDSNKDLLKKIKAGVLDSFSIGFEVIESSYNKERSFRTIEKLDIQELSLVVQPAIKNAKLININLNKKEKNMDDEVKKLIDDLKLSNTKQLEEFKKKSEEEKIELKNQLEESISQLSKRNSERENEILENSTQFMSKEEQEQVTKDIVDLAFTKFLLTKQNSNSLKTEFELNESVIKNINEDVTKIVGKSKVNYLAKVGEKLSFGMDGTAGDLVSSHDINAHLANYIVTVLNGNGLLENRTVTNPVFGLINLKRGQKLSAMPKVWNFSHLNMVAGYVSENGKPDMMLGSRNRKESSVSKMGIGYNVTKEVMLATDFKLSSVMTEMEKSFDRGLMEAILFYRADLNGFDRTTMLQSLLLENYKDDTSLQLNQMNNIETLDVDKLSVFDLRKMLAYQGAGNNFDFTFLVDSKVFYKIQLDTFEELKKNINASMQGVYNITNPIVNPTTGAHEFGGFTFYVVGEDYKRSINEDLPNDNNRKVQAELGNLLPTVPKGNPNNILPQGLTLIAVRGRDFKEFNVETGSVRSYVEIDGLRDGTMYFTKFKHVSAIHLEPNRLFRIFNKGFSPASLNTKIVTETQTSTEKKGK